MANPPGLPAIGKWMIAAAGYPVRFGHSTGYRGLIGGDLHGQLPQGRDDAFADRIFEESNNHGRSCSGRTA